MGSNFVPIESAEGWQLSNPPIFSITPLYASLKTIADVGLKELVKKSKKLTGFLEYLINELKSELIWISPKDSSIRGCQISIHVRQNGKLIFDKLTENGVICDWREPDVIRIAPVPLYNNFLDVFNFVEKLKTILNSISK